MSKCDMIRDMLPLVAEEMASEETRKFVREHVAVCSECRAALLQMQKEAGRTGDAPTMPLKAVRREMRLRRLLIAALSIILALCALTPLVSLMTRQIWRPFDKDMVYVSATERGGRKVVNSVLLKDVQNAGRYWVENLDGEAALFVYAYDTLYDTLCGKKLTVHFSERDWPDKVPVTEVYYQQNAGAQSVPVWGTGEETAPLPLPRLYLGYYLALAVISAAALGLAMLFARKAPVLRSVLGKLLCAPLCYIAAHAAILGAETTSYSAQRDCAFIWCMWALFYAACLCALRLKRK